MANEKRLIEVKSAWKKAQRIYSDPVLLHVIKNVLDETPTADAVEVKHGRWLINPDGYYPYCSECKAEPKGGEMTNYCPNCGAKMDGGNKDGSS